MNHLSDSQLESIMAQERAGVPPLKIRVPVGVPRRKRDNEEWRIQADFFRWWRATAPGLKVWPGCMWHIPNGSMLGDDKKSRMIRSRMLTLSGMVNGVLDTFLMHSAPNAVGKWNGLFVEFKKPSVRTHKNGGLSDDQVEFAAQALAHGYQCRVAYSWEEGRDAVLEYLNK